MPSLILCITHDSFCMINFLLWTKETLFSFMVLLLLDAEAYVTMQMVGPVVQRQLIVNIALKIGKNERGAFKQLILQEMRYYCQSYNF